MKKNIIIGILVVISSLFIYYGYSQKQELNRLKAEAIR